MEHKTFLHTALCWGVLGWGGPMIAMNIHDIFTAPTLWLSFVLSGLLLVGGFVWGLLIAVVIRGIQKKLRRKNPN